MSDPKQIEIIEQGVAIWNDWREDREGIAIDLSGADLRGIDLRSVELGEANIRDADIRRTSLTKANFKGADLRRAILRESNLEYANLTNTYLKKADFLGANLGRANLGRANLNGADLWGANLKHANLRGANLHKSHLQRANLLGASFKDANLQEAYLEGASFNNAKLNRANLQQADLDGVDLLRANLHDADLRNTTLYSTIFNESLMEGAMFDDATIRQSVFASVDLGGAIGLDNVRHKGPSTIGLDTLRLSRGKIPEDFLRGCGLSDWEIESAKLYTPNLRNHEISDIQYEVFRLLAQQPLQISSLFISYSHANGDFVEKVEEYLNARGIRFWRDVHDSTSGRLEKIVDRAIRLNPIVLLVLSTKSVKSDWVEHEVNLARTLEKEIGRDVLCPVTLDDEWKKPNSWSRMLMDQVKKYNILDFSNWRDDREFSNKFGLLLEGLELFYN